MNKGQLIDVMSSGANISKAQAGRALDSFISNTVNSVRSGSKVTLVGFGTFSSSKRAARTGRNPQTGATIQIPARKVVKFKAGKDFASKVR